LVWVCFGGKTKQPSTTYLKTKKILDIPSTWIDKSMCPSCLDAHEVTNVGWLSEFKNNQGFWFFKNFRIKEPLVPIF
jgi:hypothetical protein